MDHTCRYCPTVQSGPVVRFGFGFHEGHRHELFGDGKPVPQYSAEINASRSGVSLNGRFPTYSDRQSIEDIKLLLEWAWSAHCAIGKHGDHEAAKEWVRLHNASLRYIAGA